MPKEGGGIITNGCYCRVVCLCMCVVGMNQNECGHKMGEPDKIRCDIYYACHWCIMHNVGINLLVQLY